MKKIVDDLILLLDVNPVLFSRGNIFYTFMKLSYLIWINFNDNE